VTCDGEVNPHPLVGWIAGRVTCSVHAQILVGGKHVAYSATCTFTETSTGTTDVVTLTAQTHLLNGGSHSVLVAGNTITSQTGNSLKAAGVHPLLTD
jgi:hypothetical protein